MKIGILGAGSWAIALATLLHEKNHSLAMWEFSKKETQLLNEHREHLIKLPGIKIADDILITNDIQQVFNHSECIVVAVPAQTVRATMNLVAKSIDATIIEAVSCWVLVSKGIELSTLNLLTDVITQELSVVKPDRLVVLSGPSHAEEVARNIPTTVVAASLSEERSVIVQREFSTETFRIYTNTDVIGVELSASVKNVIALAAGICDGLGFGDNTKGALLTRGMVEMARLGKIMGAREETFSGLAGFGDLITTCISKHSRNRKMGELIASGLSMKEALDRMTMVAEGVSTTKSVYDLALKYNIDMPITTEIYLALYENKSPLQAVRDLMKRQFKPERV